MERAGEPLSAGRRDLLRRALAAVIVQPKLWPTAFVQARRLCARGWWKHWPLLPLPDEEYLKFRLVTAYGGTGEDLRPADLVTYLEWCR
ncbi:MAG: hypothetical protein ACRD1G_09540, partial [Acidimicrobiales bacterium]